MKFLKKASLAAAIAAAPFAVNAEMVALDDATMSSTTGQAGVTIEIDIDAAGISVGEIEYTDEGSVSMQNLTIKNVDNLTQTIDVDANGNLLIGMTGVNGMEIGLGGVDADGNNTSAVALRSTDGETTELVNNLDMTLNLGASNTTIMNLAAAGNATAIADLPLSAQSGSVAILANASIEITDMNVGLFGYTQAQADVRGTAYADLAAANYATAYAAVTDTSGDGSNADEQAAFAAASGYDSDNDGSMDTTVYDGIEATATQTYADGSAVQIGGLKFYGTGGEGTAATIEQTLWAKGGSAADGGGVYIQIGEIAGTLEVDSIAMGGASIGSIKVSDINLAGMTQRIYGH